MNTITQQNVKVKAAVFFILFGVSCSALSETFTECILENMQGVSTQVAAVAINRACRQKALPYVPDKCSVFFLAAPVSYSNCINHCSEAGFWSNTFGDCKP